MASTLFAQKQQLAIVPQPQSINLHSGKPVQLLLGDTIVVPDNTFALPAQWLADYYYQFLGLRLHISTQKTAGKITFSQNKNLAQEGYRLNVNDHIDLQARTSQGAFHAVATLIQILPDRAGIIPQLQPMTIDDQPRFPFRGMHLDVVRHFFPVSFIRRYIDWLALHKFNYFHWHLTDDQGWRIEIKALPELTTKGSYRAGEIRGYFPGTYAEEPYQAFYTQDEVRQVLDYARSRGVEVIPEIDIPGHCMAVIATYPQTSTTPDIPKHTAQTWGIYNRQNNVLAPTPATFDLLNKVFTEVCELFPGQYIHAGGDECAPRWWNESPATQQFMKQQGLANARELQGHMMNYVRRIINAHGKTMIGWDGGSEGADPDGTVIMQWHNEEATDSALIDSDHRLIIASGRWFYLTHPYPDMPRDSTNRSLPLSTRQVYEFNLLPAEATAKHWNRLLGVEGCLWSEYVPTERIAEQQLFPRMAAIAEQGWTAADAKSWPDFARRLGHLLHLYDLWSIRPFPEKIEGITAE